MAKPRKLRMITNPIPNNDRKPNPFKRKRRKR